MSANYEKICVICKNWKFYPGSPGYSELTPGCEASVSCIGAKKMVRKNKRASHPGDVWNGDAMMNMDESDWRKAIRVAEECPDFEAAKD